MGNNSLLFLLSPSTQHTSTMLTCTILSYPGTIVIKAGYMDSITDSAVENYISDIEIFIRSRVCWIPGVEGTRQEVEDFTRLGEF